MQADDPPYLPVGTAVSAKYKGAFCEAKVSKVVRLVKCKVSYKNGLGNATVNDDIIKGTLRVGQLVQVKHPDKKDILDATITKIQDCSQYTVVFDDGDITTLRRSALCLKSGRHFNESETLDQLPLTHPEHFGNPVVGGRRGRRSRQLKEDSSDGEGEEENEPDLEQYSTETGRVVCVETSDKKRSKDNWFPGLVVMPSAQPTVKINVKDEYLVRSFKDGRYYTVPKKEVTDFTREIAARVESNVLSEAVEKALKYLDHDELPVHWEKSTLFNLQSQYTDSEENFSDSSDDEPREEKDHFVAQLYKFMDDSGTPLNKSPMINNKDVDLYRLFTVVNKLGGHNRVTNQNKWRAVAVRLKFPNNQNMANQVKLVYKKCLISYEIFFRRLGCTLLNNPRNSKKGRERALIRGKERITPVQSPRPDKEEPEQPEKKEEEEKPKVKKEVKPKVEEKKPKEKEKEVVEKENSDTNDSGETTDQSETPSSSKETPRARRAEVKTIMKEKITKPPPPPPEKPKPPPEPKVEEPPKKEEKDDKVQQTRSKTQLTPKTKEALSPERKPRDTKTPMRETPNKPNPPKSAKKPVEDDKKRGRKRNTDDKAEGTAAEIPPVPAVNVGDKLKVYYGPTHESKVTYEAKVIDTDKDSAGPIYLVHYTGWNNRYDEWIVPQRIAENLSATTKAKRLKQNSAAASKSGTSKGPAKRGRGMSITGRSTIPDAPRSTTPSSITSSSSRTKSPATPATRNSSRLAKQGEQTRRTRRSSVQTDNSIHTDTDTEPSESESEAPRTRSSGRTEENESRPVRKKLTKTKGDKRKDDEDTEKEDEVERPKRNKKLKKLADIQPDEDSDEEASNPTKGRDFDLNQIRSELKGLSTKAVKVPSTTDTSEKDAASSDESTNTQEEEKIKEEEIIEIEEKETTVDNNQSSDDIYEFKEPEPFEFETRKTSEEKPKKRLVPRVLDDVDKSPKRRPIKPPVVKPEIPKENVVEEKKFFKRASVKKVEEVEEEEKEKEEVKKLVVVDPFDKLVESPSFHIGKVSDKVIENKEREKVVKNLAVLDEGPSTFNESTEEDTDEKVDTSDNEEISNEPIFPIKEEESVSNLQAASPEPFVEEITTDDFTPKIDEKKKDSDDDDHIRESIQRAIAQTSLTDDDSNDALLIDQPSTFSISTEEVKPPIIPPLEEIEPKEEVPIAKVIVEEKEIKVNPEEKINILPKQISPVFQETDTSLLEAMCVVPQIVPKIDDFKSISIKSGPKIAETLLQKLTQNKVKIESDIKPTTSSMEPSVAKIEIVPEISIKEEVKEEVTKSVDIKPKVVDSKFKKGLETKLKPAEIKSKPETPSKVVEVKSKPIVESFHDSRKRTPRGKILSREFIEDSDSDSSDSEERLVIARSDDDSQMSVSLDNKPDIKESDSNNSVFKPITDDSQTQEERNFKFDNVEKTEPEYSIPEPMELESKEDLELVKEEEPDSDLHSLLICEETIPGSPAPASVVEEKPVVKSKSVMEMPFASAPCSSSSNKNMLITNESIPKSVAKEKLQSPQLMVPLKVEERPEVPTVIDNTPPTTPESTLSNLSPRGDNGDMSPTNADNDSCKSGEVDNDFSNQRPPNKISPYSEEDTLMTSEPSSNKKTKEEPVPSPCKKRRRSHKGSISEDVPFKKGRRLNRSRHNSDSDDTSEHSMTGSNALSSTTNLESRFRRSPRPRKYNFYVDFDNTTLDRVQRIAIITQKIHEIKKCYQEEKNELAAIEKRRKKIKRRKKENAKAAKQEIMCT